MGRFCAIIFFVFVQATVMAQFMNVRNWNKTERDSLEKGLSLLEEKNTQLALPIFENILNNHPGEEFLKYSYAKCAIYHPDRHSDAYKRLNEVYQKNRKTPDIQYYMAMAAYYNYNYDEALTHISAYLSNRKIQPDARKNAEILKRQVNYARYFFTHPTKAKVYNLGVQVNSEFDESLPAISADESRFIYTNAGPGRPSYMGGNKDSVKSAAEVIYSCGKIDGELSKPVSLRNPDGSGAFSSLSLSNDGRLLYMYKENGDDRGDLYALDFNAAKPFPEKLQGAVNTIYRESYCSLSPDGKTLYFSSDRPGGRGGKDIYRASLSADSSWVNVVNLGDSVNTAYDEDSPFIHADGKTLFFSSKAHANMGGYDVFKTVMNLKDSVFKKAENLGSPINSPTDELHFVISANAENAYFTSNRKDGRGRQDIYHVEPNLKGFKPSLCLLKGKITRNNEAVKAVIRVEAISGKVRFQSLLSSGHDDGLYLVALPTGAEYQLTYTIPNYKSKTAIIDLADMVGFVEKMKNISFDAILDSIKPAPIKTTEIVKTPPQKPDFSKDTLLLKESKTNSAAPALAAHTPSAEVPHKTAHQSPYFSHDTLMLKTKLLNAEPPLPLTQLNVDSIVIESTFAKTESVKSIKKDTVTVMRNGHGVVITGTLAPEKAKPLMANHPVKKDSAAKVGISTNTLSSVKTKSSVPVNIVAADKATIKSEKKPGWINDGFEPNTATQEKMMMNAFKYGDITYDSLDFRVQISAFKNNQHYFFPKLEKFGKIEKVELGDGYKRLMLGGIFKTYGRAFAYSKKIIKAGHDDVFIVVIYKGYRYSVEDLEEVGIFK